jgi:hypothetical protein
VLAAPAQCSDAGAGKKEMVVRVGPSRPSGLSNRKQKGMNHAKKIKCDVENLEKKILRIPENKNETVDLKFYSPLKLEDFMLSILAKQYLPYIGVYIIKHSENIVLTSSFYYFNPTPSVYAYLCIVLYYANIRTYIYNIKFVA